MSWAEVKKLNSDLSTPLNIASLINHIDLIGGSYTGISMALVKSDELYNHEIALDVITNTAMLADNIDTYGVILICTLADTPYTSFTSFANILEDETAMTAVIASSKAMTAVANSEIAMTAVAASETAMTAVIASETAMTAVIASSAAINEIINNDVALYCISQDTTALSSLASSIENTTTILWESDVKWQTIYDTLNASALFTKSGLLTDTGGTKNRSGNLITLINAASTIADASYKVSITPAHTGCYEKPYTPTWSTGKHIMWGGHTGVFEKSDGTKSYVKHYMFTPIV